MKVACQFCEKEEVLTGYKTSRREVNIQIEIGD